MAVLTITPFQRRYLRTTRDLLFYSHLVHTHLDWHDTDSWLETQTSPIRLAWQGGRLTGILAFSEPLNHMAWVRLAAVQDYTDHQAVLRALWEAAVDELRERQVRQVALLAIHDWIGRYAPALGFEYVEDVITLARSGPDIPAALPNRLVIRPAEQADLERMAVVDQMAFAPPWQLRLEELQVALRAAASCTVGVLDGTIVGYQLSTMYFDGAHLARLAVLPDVQGRGLGGALLGDVIRRFSRRGIFSMTLNTQASNQRSQRLYARYGFRPNGHNLPYWVVTL